MANAQKLTWDFSQMWRRPPPRKSLHGCSYIQNEKSYTNACAQYIGGDIRYTVTKEKGTLFKRTPVGVGGWWELVVWHSEHNAKVLPDGNNGIGSDMDGDWSLTAFQEGLTLSRDHFSMTYNLSGLPAWISDWSVATESSRWMYPFQKLTIHSMGQDVKTQQYRLWKSADKFKCSQGEYACLAQCQWKFGQFMLRNKRHLRVDKGRVVDRNKWKFFFKELRFICSTNNLLCARHYTLPKHTILGSSLLSSCKDEALESDMCPTMSGGRNVLMKN